MQKAKKEHITAELERDETQVSICPAGEAFPLPNEADYEIELTKLKKNGGTSYQKKNLTILR